MIRGVLGAPDFVPVFIIVEKRDHDFVHVVLKVSHLSIVVPDVHELIVAQKHIIIERLSAAVGLFAAAKAEAASAQTPDVLAPVFSNDPHFAVGTLTGVLLFQVGHGKRFSLSLVIVAVDRGSENANVAVVVGIGCR